jgi:hypothetical protein
MPLVLVSDAQPTVAGDGVIRTLRRGDEVVYVVREGTPEGGLRVTAYGPGNAQDVHDCPDVTTAGARVLDIERRLFAQGFESDARHAA